MNKPKRTYRSAQGWRNTKRKAKTVLRRAKRLKLSRRAIKNILLLILILGIVGSLSVLGLFAYVSRDLPDPNNLGARSISQSTKIYDRTGEHLLYEVGEGKRTVIKMKEGFCGPSEDLETQENGIPRVAAEAIVSAEDAIFCEHSGFSIKGLARAVIFRGSRGGGSTLTQQLVKNAILTNERSLIRKAKELILSIELERRYNKDEILQIYFNEISYGSVYFGIEAASENYFGHGASELTIAEAATLAAIPKAPTRYLNDPEALKARRDWILGRMQELGYATQEEIEEAKQEDTSIRVSVTDINAPHFVFYVKEILEERYGQRLVGEGGLKVVTSLDWDMQEKAETAVREGVEESGERYGFENASLVAMDPKTGQILAMVGSKDYFAEDIDGQVNVSTRLRQPGSSFKPIVYAKGFEMGYSPSTVLWDVKTAFPGSGRAYSPNNYDLRERGPIKVRQALQGSLNIPAVKMLYLVGVQNAIDFAEQLGYTNLSERRDELGLAMVLGGAEVRLLEHVGAYATFANEGVRQDISPILKVETPDGEVLEEWKESDGTRVTDENIANMLTDVLSDNNARAYAFGTGSLLQLGGRPVAAKTGTTNDYRDAWTVGYTPSLVAGVWGGNNDNSEMNRGGGSSVAAPIWNAFMRAALADQPVEYFQKPTLAPAGKDMLDGKLSSVTVTVDKASGKLATEYTPDAYREERTYANYHSILHYVNRSDPRGDAPGNPGNDPHYAAWEGAIASWIERNEEKTGIKISQDEPPTETDDVHVPANFPTVGLIRPSDGATVSGRSIEISATATAPRGVSRVEFYVDGFFLGSDGHEPFSLNAELPSSVGRGSHTVRAVAYDDVGNSGSSSASVRVDADADASLVNILDPHGGQTIERVTETFTVVVSLDGSQSYSSVSLYAEQIGSGARQAVDVKADPSSPFIAFDWTLPMSGDWVLSASATIEGGGSARSPGIVVHVVSPAGAEPAQEEDGQQPAPEEELPLNPFERAAALGVQPEPAPEPTPAAEPAEQPVQ